MPGNGRGQAYGRPGSFCRRARRARPRPLLLPFRVLLRIVLCRQRGRGRMSLDGETVGSPYPPRWSSGPIQSSNRAVGGRQAQLCDVSRSRPGAAGGAGSYRSAKVFSRAASGQNEGQGAARTGMKQAFHATKALPGTALGGPGSTPLQGEMGTNRAAQVGLPTTLPRCRQCCLATARAAPPK